MPLKTNAATPGIAYAIPKSHELVLAATRYTNYNKAI
jgi:hypothetical protein